MQTINNFRYIDVVFLANKPEDMLYQLNKINDVGLKQRYLNLRKELWCHTRCFKAMSLKNTDPKKNGNVLLLNGYSLLVPEMVVSLYKLHMSIPLSCADIALF